MHPWTDEHLTRPSDNVVSDGHQSTGAHGANACRTVSMHADMTFEFENAPGLSYSKGWYTPGPEQTCVLGTSGALQWSAML